MVGSLLAFLIAATTSRYRRDLMPPLGSGARCHEINFSRWPTLSRRKWNAWKESQDEESQQNETGHLQRASEHPEGSTRAPP